MKTLLEIINTDNDPDILSAEVDGVPLIHLNGWQTIKDYAEKIGTSDKYIYKLIKQGKIQHMRIKQLNNLYLVKEKPE